MNTIYLSMPAGAGTPLGWVAARTAPPRTTLNKISAIAPIATPVKINVRFMGKGSFLLMADCSGRSVCCRGSLIGQRAAGQEGDRRGGRAGVGPRRTSRGRAAGDATHLVQKANPEREG